MGIVRLWIVNTLRTCVPSSGVVEYQFCSRPLLSSVAGLLRQMNSCLIDQPLVMNSAASQSSNSGCVGRSPVKPKSLGVATIPRPK